MQHLKVRNQPAREVIELPAQIVERTLARVAQLVGSTLGPGGCPVLIERQEYGLPPFFTKDGVTVYRNLGFENAAEDLVMETVRDVAVRTANEAGDGTTTATILTNALVRGMRQFCANNRSTSPQRVVRRLEVLMKDGLNYLQGAAVQASLQNEDGRRLLRSVACTSANGDEQLADAAIKAMTIAGDWGNVVLTEGEGEGYHVEKIAGYTIPIGWEDTCKSLWPNWITDRAQQSCRIDRPHVLVYNGRLNQISTIRPVIERLGRQWDAFESGNTDRLYAIGVEEGLLSPPMAAGKPITFQDPNGDGGVWMHPLQGPLKSVLSALTPQQIEAFRKYEQSINLNVVVVAAGFSEQVLTDFFMNFRKDGGYKLVPILAPHGPTSGYQQQVMQDIAACAGTKILDPVAAASGNYRLSDLGPGIAAFEAFRVRSNFEGSAHEHALDKESESRLKQLLAQRLMEVERQVKAATSTLDRAHVLERMAKLGGGLCRLVVRGASNSDIRERRDRAEDAVCAIRGAMKHGCLPGACWGLTAMVQHLLRTIPAEAVEDIALVTQILAPAFQEPFRRLFGNAGFPVEEIDSAWTEHLRRIDEFFDIEGGSPASFDIVSRKWINPFEAGLLDSAPAVLEAVRSAMALMQLGTLSGIIAFKRDSELERREAQAATAYQRGAGIDETEGRL